MYILHLYMHTSILHINYKTYFYIFVYIYTQRHTVQKKNQRAIFNMNIWSKKQIVGEQGNFKLELV